MVSSRTPRDGRGRMDFEAMIERGELDGPDGFKAYTVNGTSYAMGTGWNKNTNEDPKQPKRPYLKPDKTRPAGRSNRTGE